MKIEVEIDVDDVLEELSDEDLRGYLDDRGIEGVVSFRDVLGDVRDLLLRGQPQAALALIESALFPKKSAAGLYEKAKAARDPETGRPIIP